MSDDRHISDEALQEALDYVLQRHTQASKGGRSHADFRFGNPAEGLESYAIPKGRLPELKERLLAVNTAIHPHGYLRYQGSWGSGKGKNTVKILESGKISVKNDKNGSKTLEILEKSPQRRFKLIKIGVPGRESWIIVGLEPQNGENPAFPGENVKSADFSSKNDVSLAKPSKKYRSARFLDKRTGKTVSKLCISIPNDQKSKEKGLGGRFGLPKGLGMLFLHCSSFWMKDVPFDLDLVRLDRQFEITEIQHMKGSFKNFDLPVYRPSRPTVSVHAIELPGGYCSEKGLTVGDRLVVGK